MKCRLTLRYRRQAAPPILAACLASLRWMVGRRLQLNVLRGFQQIAAVLNQQVERIDNVGNIFEVGVFEGQAGESLEQVCGCADALVGGGLCPGWSTGRDHPARP